MTEVNEMIKSLVVIPGSGEFVYDTEVVKDSDGTPVNILDGSGETIASKTVNDLGNHFPNLKKVSLVIGWYANNTDSSSLTIEPRIESKDGDSGDWHVGNFDRSNTKVSADGNSTPSDKSIIDLVHSLTEKGYDVTVYPMLFTDNETQSWRGSITPKNHAEVDHFYSEYNKFIEHYANLEVDGVKMKDMIKSIIVGSEMTGLLQYDDGSHTYYAVDKMIELTSNIKGIVGNDVDTIYAANWDDYGRHPEDGYYYLDKLYKAVDKVGIDAYFKLTDQTYKGDITKDVIKHAWESGIDYDYYLDDSGQKHVIDDPSYAIKNLKWWYSHEHINPDGSKSVWTPGGKEVIATEIGFSSIDHCTNDPSSFYVPGMEDSSIPHGSTGKASPESQLLAIEATVEYWNDVHTHDTDGTYDGLFDQLDWYSYDIRGDFGHDSHHWGDAQDYFYGHWLKC